VICSTCGTENDAGRKFCIECAAGLVAGCPNCGTLNPPAAKFCGECATQLAGASPARNPTPPTRPAEGTPGPVAERRLVSVLFADLVGFTPFAEERDAEEVRDTLSRYFEVASDVIGRYGGTVEKFIGDAVMAVWGAPSAHEDDAERAVRAGLELVDAVRALGPTIQARAGILTGEAAVTIGATNQGMVAGDLVNTAARLQAAAQPGTVLVGEATQRAASRAIAFEEAGEQALKGKSAPVAAWRALRVVAEVGGRNRSETLEAPFVGRDDELRLLKDLFHATAREGRARLVSVIGPGGIGKTRIAWEFLKYLDGLVETVWFHEGRSPAYGEGISFWALGEMVRRRAGLLETHDAATTRAGVATMLAEYVPDPDDRRWIEPALLSLLGVETGVGSEQLFGAWRTFFERLATTAPVVLVFEDFHFADSGLINFVDHLMEWSRHAPIYVVTLSRPELFEKRPEWGAGKRNFTSLYLEPLSAPAMRQLLAGLIAGLPEAAVRAIVARADGIPLYAVETVRMLLAEGRLIHEGGAYRPTGDLGDLAVPETLTALIASRLDALEPADRATLQDAAVLGQSFTLAGLAIVSGMPEADLEGRLRSLSQREFLRVDADPRSPERGQYGFVQALIREVAYNMMARADRKTRHLAAARHFEALGSDELAGALASQYLAAHANSTAGPERDALAGQARIALRAAADRAASLGAHEQALRFCEQALTVASDPADEAILHERAADSAAAVQRIEDAATHYRAAIERRVGIQDRSGEARVTAAYAGALLMAYRFDDGLAVLTEASDRFADLAEDPGVVTLNGQLARAWFMKDENAKAVAVADRVLAVAERSNLIEVVADTLVTRGSALAGDGRRYEGIGAIEAGQRLAAANSLHATVGRALNNIASFLVDDDPRAALEAGREGIALDKRMGSRSFQIMDNAVTAAMRTGDWDWAAAQLDPMLSDEIDPVIRLVAIADTIALRAVRGEPIDRLQAEAAAMPPRPGDLIKPATIAFTGGYLGFVGGQFDVARRELLRYAEVFPPGAPEAALLAARCDLLAGDAAQARKDMAAIDASPRRGRAIDADRTTILAGIAALEGRTTEALTGYRQALGVWRDLGLVWDEALCAIDMASVLDPSDPEVASAAGAGRTVLLRLGATPFLDRLDAAITRPRPAERAHERAAEGAPRTSAPS
jgi:class 3 adenylate cyclase/tetratricopeptide (TPR) repeat protein